MIMEHTHAACRPNCSHDKMRESGFYPNVMKTVLGHERFIESFSSILSSPCPLLKTFGSISDPCDVGRIWTLNFFIFPKIQTKSQLRINMQCWVAQDSINGMSHMGSFVCVLPAMRGWFIWLVDHVCPFVFFVSCFDDVAQTSLSCGRGSRGCCHRDFRGPVSELETWFRAGRAMAGRWQS